MIKINAVRFAQKNRTGQPWVKPGHDDKGLEAQHEEADHSKLDKGRLEPDSVASAPTEGL